MARITDTVKTLLIANILFFVGSKLIGDQAIQYFAFWFPKNGNFRIWQVVTHMFMHANLAHIFFNMFALWMFGSVLEHSIGQKRFLFLYFSAGLGAVLLQLLFTYYNYHTGIQELIDSGMDPDKVHELIKEGEAKYAHNMRYTNDTLHSVVSAYVTPMIGASGAVFGVLAAFAIIFPNLPLYIIFIPIPIKAKYLIGGYFALELFSGITGSGLFGPSNTAHWAHVGGAVVGFFIMWYWKRHQFDQNQWH